VSDHEHVRTERLQLDAVTDGDLTELQAVESDLAGAQLHGFVAGWDRDALGLWAVRLAESGRLVGVGGASVRSGRVWELHHRLAADAQDYADELLAAARASAADVRPELPVVASVLEQDEAARAVAERAGLHLVWRGSDHDGVRLIFADRDLSPDELDSLTH
jgi:RimJ/RimL family protein N-acetyltransferase